jgi:hypothetical protein
MVTVKGFSAVWCAVLTIKPLLRMSDSNVITTHSSSVFLTAFVTRGSY